MLKLYYLEDPSALGYDQYYGMAIVAHSEEQAIDIAMKNCGSIGSGSEWDRSYIKCKEIDLVNGNARLICSKFHAG